MTKVNWKKRDIENLTYRQKREVKKWKRQRRREVTELRTAQIAAIEQHVISGEYMLSLVRARKYAWEQFISRLAIWRYFVSITLNEQLLTKRGSFTKVGNRVAWREAYDFHKRWQTGKHFTVLEYHKSGMPHIHALTSDLSSDWRTVKEVQARISGWCRVYPIDDRSGAVNYVAKYCAKGGDAIEFQARVPGWQVNLQDWEEFREYDRAMKEVKDAAARMGCEEADGREGMVLQQRRLYGAISQRRLDW